MSCASDASLAPSRLLVVKPDLRADAPAGDGGRVRWILVDGHAEPAGATPDVERGADGSVTRFADHHHEVELAKLTAREMVIKVGSRQIRLRSTRPIEILLNDGSADPTPKRSAHAKVGRR